jgi:hypothetical protein
MNANSGIKGYMQVFSQMPRRFDMVDMVVGDKNRPYGIQRKPNLFQSPLNCSDANTGIN